MKLILTIFTTVFAFNAFAYSFTEAMSAKHKPGIKAQAEQVSTLSKEDKEICEPVVDHSELVKWLLVAIAVMLSIVYIQHRKIQSLSAEEE